MPNTAVTLRTTEPDDYRYLESWWNDHAIADGCRDTLETLSKDTVDALFHAWSDNNNEHQFGRTILDGSGTVLGHIAAWGCEDPDRDATMAILIGPYFQNHGYGSQAMKLGITLAAKQLRAKTITLKVWSFNLRARHMYESLGFKEVDRRRESVERNERLFDEVIYEAAVPPLLASIAEEEIERTTGEELERQRFHIERPSDFLPRR
jgi:RimJ/RimL family protein N-acetyltransferase